jgi:hypothetical protein
MDLVRACRPSSGVLKPVSIFEAFQELSASHHFVNHYFEEKSNLMPRPQVKD